MLYGISFSLLLLMIEILHYLKDPKPWELRVHSLLWGHAPQTLNPKP